MICPYCEQEKKEVNSYGSIDNRFDYACSSCNKLYVDWLEGKTVDQAEWPAHLKTIAECSEIYKNQCEADGVSIIPRHQLDHVPYMKDFCY